jgi:hypothetical protein
MALRLQAAGTPAEALWVNEHPQQSEIFSQIWGMSLPIRLLQQESGLRMQALIRQSPV